MLPAAIRTIPGRRSGPDYCGTLRQEYSEPQIARFFRSLFDLPLLDTARGDPGSNGSRSQRRIDHAKLAWRKWRWVIETADAERRQL